VKREDLDNRFAFHAADTVKRDQHAAIREACRAAAGTLDELCPDSRELSLAITALEEAMMWGNAALARHDGGERIS
jgi:hypothetical protein